MTWTKKSLIAFERKVADAFLAKQIKAPIHLSGGNEDQLIATFKDVRPGDWVLSTWRSHYHALLKGVPEEWVWNEILAGRSMYLMNREHRFLSSAIVGGTLPIACGVGMGIKRKREEYLKSPAHNVGKMCGYAPPPINVSVAMEQGWYDSACGDHLEKVWVFVGDMTARTGLFHEFCRYVEGHKLPVRIVIEDNSLSTNTPTREAWGEGNTLSFKTYKYERTYPHVGVGVNVVF